MSRFPDYPDSNDSRNPENDGDPCRFLDCENDAVGEGDRCEAHQYAKACADGCGCAGDEELNGRCETCSAAHASPEA